MTSDLHTEEYALSMENYMQKQVLNSKIVLKKMSCWYDSSWNLEKLPQILLLYYPKVHNRY